MLRHPLSLTLLVCACVLGGCTVLLGIDTPGENSTNDAAVADAAVGPDGRIDAAPPIDAQVFDAIVPDARGNPVTTLAMGQPVIRGLAIDLNSVYWSTIEGPIMRINKDGTAPGMLADGPDAPEGALYVHNGFVYWITREFQAPFRMYRTSSGGGGSFIRIIGAVGSPFAFTVDATGIHYTNGFNVFHAELDGTNQTLLWPTQTDPFYMVKDAAHTYWTVFGNVDGTVGVLELANGQNQTIASGLNQPHAIVADGTRAYWANLGMNNPSGGGGILEHTSSLMSVSPDGTDMTVITSGDTRIHAIAVDASFVYWFSADMFAIVRRAKDGTGPIDVLAVPSEPFVQNLVVDSTSMYWVTQSTVQKASKVP